MQARKLMVVSLLAVFLLESRVQVVLAQPPTAGSGSHAPLPAGILAPSVTLRAASGATIEFATQNGQTMRGIPPRALDLPHLVLTRNGTLTDPNERTLIVTVGNLVVPPGGVTVTLTVESYHSDPDAAGDSGDRITVWRTSGEVSNSSDSTQRGGMILFQHEFTETVMVGADPIATPTDYFRIQVAVFEAGTSGSDPSYIVHRDPGFLMERQHVAPLQATARASEKAGPEALIVYYCDMFPFQRDTEDAGTLLHREEVPTYVEAELAPAMLEAIRVQTEDWGFAWSEAWTSYRGGHDSKQLSVALSEGETWYHGLAPKDGHAAIAIRVTGGPNANYGTLTDGLMSTFHHELFHNLQRGIVQELGGHGEVDGRDHAWEFFSEGTAVLASSVGQPAVQFAETLDPRAYLFRARRFVGGGGYAGDLNSSYEKMTSYHAAIYWRFLYEQCGGLEEPRVGMNLIHHVLETLYSKEIVDIAPSAVGASANDLVGQLPAIMDAVLSGPDAASCPFRTYDESLVHFSRAIYGLRLVGGRCMAPGVPADCGFYDPNELYYAPPISKLTYGGQELEFGAAEQPYPAGIRSSYGMDFVEVVLDDKVNGQPLTLGFKGDPEGGAEFSVQLWKLMDDGTGTSWQPSLTASSPAETLIQKTADGRLLYTIPEIDTGVYNRLGLMITRLDSQEDLDAGATYTLELYPGDRGAG
jgi:hypothetical protein